METCPWSPRIWSQRLSLLFLALVSLASVSSARAQSAPEALFIGAWCNRDFATRSITRLEIERNKNAITVHGWGRCHPTECDWGKTPATFASAGGTELTAIWNHGFSIVTLKLSILADGSLQGMSSTHYTDQSGRKDSEDTSILAKGLKHDWSDRR